MQQPSSAGLPPFAQPFQACPTEEMLGNRVGRRSLAAHAPAPQHRRRPVDRLRHFRGDWVITISNAVSLVLLLGILYFKSRESAGLSVARRKRWWARR
jgi:hypothetical protein